MFTSEDLRALCRYDVRPARPVRKAIFSLRLWRPARQRLHQQRLRHSASSPGQRQATDNGVALGCVNARSVGNKAAMLCRIITDEHLDILAITETWHECSESTVLKRVTPLGYNCIDAARPIPPDVRRDSVDFQNHGGLAFVFRQTIKFQERHLDTATTTFEYLCGFASVGDKHFVLLGVYRPGSQVLSAAFFDELSAVLELLAVYGCPVVVCGDFNVHVDQPDDVHAVRLADLLQSFGCVQHVAEPTHNAGHILDLVITTADTLISDLRVGVMVSDHMLIRFILHVNRPASDAQKVTRRAWRRLSRDAFASDLAASKLCSDLSECDDMSVDDMVQLYNRALTELLDKHCPSVMVRCRDKQATPWFDADCRAARRHTRAAERRYRRTRSDADKSLWWRELQALRQLYEMKNCSFWRTEIAESKGNMKRLWRTLYGVLGEASSGDVGELTAEDFAVFFKDKVESVRASTASTPLYDVPSKATPTLEQWTAVTSDEIAKLIGSALCKSCQLDPAPTWLVKDMRWLLSPFISLLFNKSLVSGCYPSEFKKAVVRPLLKKHGLDASQTKNHRPVSNLPFLSKLLERIVQRRLQTFLDKNGLMPKTQSAYRQYHSTETVVTKVYNDMLMAADGGQVSALCLLDLSAAFDTVDHDLLTRRLERQYGLRGVVLQWFSSYLSDRIFQVVYGGSTSSTVHIPCSVPQGSVLGPRLFILYTADLEDHVAEHGVSFHAFADDTQLYVHCRRDDVTSAVLRLENCIEEVSHWMSANRLKLNAEKTELLWAGSRHGSALLGSAGPSLQLRNETVAASDQVRVLGVTLTSDLCVDKHVANVCATCFYWLRQLRRVRRPLDAESAATLVHAFVTSRVDYCNAILAGAPKSITDKLQRVMNAAARVVSDTRKYDRGLTHLLHNELHWLDVPQRVQYKLCATVHRCLQHKAPQYMTVCCIHTSDIARRQHLRSASSHQLFVPRHRRSMFGRRAFSVAGPAAWNSLPDYLRDPTRSIDSFRRDLKTFLFSFY